MITTDGKHTTNYFDTFIEVAPDCPVRSAEIPQQEGEDKTVANLQYEILSGHPYEYTSDEAVFSVFAKKNNIAKENLNKESEKFFSKGQPCLRCSPRGKRYGLGVHCNKQGKVALFVVESKEYQKLVNDKTIKHFTAMRSKRG